jgi:hypothetical protein
MRIASIDPFLRFFRIIFSPPCLISIRPARQRFCPRRPKTFFKKVADSSGVLQAFSMRREILSARNKITLD